MVWNAVILAAGRGRRMGGPKAFLPFGDGTLLDAQLWALRGASRIAVVVAADLWEGLSSPDIGPGKGLPQEQTILVPNPRVEEGPFISIQLGLAALGGDDPAIVVPVDCPVALDAPRRLVDAVAPGLAWAAPTHDGRKGHPVLLTTTGKTVALAPDAGPTLRDLMAATPGALVPLASPMIHYNLNTPADRDRFLAEYPFWPDTNPGDSQ